MHIDPQYDYVWSPGRNHKNVTISMLRRPLTIDVEKDGIRASFDVQAEHSNEWSCPTRTVPILPISPEYFYDYLVLMDILRLSLATISM